MSATTEQPIETVDLGDLEVWRDGPPHELFDRLRREAPVHWSPMATWDDEPGFWSITRAEDIERVSRDWQTFSSERGGILAHDTAVPVDIQNGMFIGMDPPRHDRIKAIFQKVFAPKPIAQHEPTIRAIAEVVVGRLEGRRHADLVQDVAQPIVARVIGRFLGLPEKDDAVWADLTNRGMGFGDDQLQPRGLADTILTGMEAVPLMVAEVRDRRARPTDDLISALVHAEVDGERLDDSEIVWGIALLLAAGHDSTRATFANGMLGLLREPEAMARLVAQPELIGDAVEEFLRMYPAFSHFRRTATQDVEMHGVTIREGDKVVLWYPSSNRDESLYECPHQLDVERKPEHHAFGAGGRHFCLGTALARLELRVMFEVTLRRFPNMELIEEPERVASLLINQPRSVPVRL